MRMSARILAFFSLLAASSTAFGIEFGTKFVCCEASTASCLGGGGAQIWATTLRDRALTQIDAKIRCGTDTMYWGTHACPASESCSDSQVTIQDPTGPAAAWCAHPSAYKVYGDFDGDGKTDVFCHDATGSGNKWAWLSRFSYQNYLNNWCSHQGARVYVVNANNDGLADVMCQDSAGSRWFFYGDSYSGFRWQP